MPETEIRYGRIVLDGQRIGYCTYQENGDKIEIFCPPYKPLIVKKNGVTIPCTPEHVMVWTKVAGWLGTSELIATLH